MKKFFFCVIVCLVVVPASAIAQVRGVYPLGMSATNSGITPEPGFSYVNQLLIYTRDELKGPNGEVQATGRQAVVMNMNSFVWVSKGEVLGAKFSMSATLPFANNSLTSDLSGDISGGGGFADSAGWEPGPAIAKTPVCRGACCAVSSPTTGMSASTPSHAGYSV